MKLLCEKDIENQQTRYTLVMTDLDLIKVRLGAFDKLLIDKCEQSDKVSDKLLGLETIARKVEANQ